MNDLEARHNALMSIPGSIVSGDAQGIVSNIAVAKGMGTETAGMWALLVKVVQDPKGTIEAINNMINVLKDGLKYLADHFGDLLLSFASNLVKAIPSMALNAAKVLGRATAAVFTLGLSEIFGSWFGHQETMQEKTIRVLNELAGAINNWNAVLVQQGGSAIASAMGPAAQNTWTEFQFGEMQRQRHQLEQDYFHAVTSGDSETAKAKLEEIGKIQSEMISTAADWYSQELDQIQAEYDLKKEEHDKQAGLIQEQITNLQQWKKTAEDAFKAVREAILGSSLGTTGNLSRLKDEYYGAATPEAKAAAAQAYAGGIQQQYDAMKSLAESGAISGETWAKMQADLLKQLDQAQADATSSFDNLIDIQTQALKVLNDGFALVTQAFENQKTALLSQFATIIWQLDQIIKINPTSSGGNATQTNPSLNNSYRNNTNGFKATVKYG
jgi:hypothetical protein